MSDQATPPPSAAPPPPPPEPITEFHIGDEFGTAKRNLPPAGIVLICIAAVAIAVAVVAFHGRAKPPGRGAGDLVAAAEVPGQGIVLAAITLTLRNATDKPLWIHTLKAQLARSEERRVGKEGRSRWSPY